MQGFAQVLTDSIWSHHPEWAEHGALPNGREPGPFGRALGKQGTEYCQRPARRRNGGPFLPQETASWANPRGTFPPGNGLAAAWVLPSQ
jgi:hypothetical protein